MCMLRKTSSHTVTRTHLKTNRKTIYELFPESIFDCDSPKSTLADSAFLGLYNEYDRNRVNKRIIRSILPSELQDKLDDEMYGISNTEEICVWLWSLGSRTSGLYKKMNRALYADDREEIKRFMPIYLD